MLEKPEKIWREGELGCYNTHPRSLEDNQDSKVSWLSPPEDTKTRKVQRHWKHQREGESVAATFLHLPKIIYVLFPTLLFCVYNCNIYYYVLYMYLITHRLLHCMNSQPVSLNQLTRIGLDPRSHSILSRFRSQDLPLVSLLSQFFMSVIFCFLVLFNLYPETSWSLTSTE